MRWLLSMLAALVTMSVCGAETGLLDGTKWKITVTPDKQTAAKGEKAYEETLLFASGKMMASASAARGFGPSPYLAERKDDTIHWQAEPISPTAGKALWSGEAKGRSIRGTLNCVKKDNSLCQYSFSGERE